MSNKTLLEYTCAPLCGNGCTFILWRKQGISNRTQFPRKKTDCIV